ncbi:hypothetical protein GCM10017562_68760 [Streptomyces roseofulvus]
MPGREPGAYLEERLSVPFGQLVEDHPARRVGQRLEQILLHAATIGKSPLAYQAGRAGPGSPVPLPLSDPPPKVGRAPAHP